MAARERQVSAEGPGDPVPCDDRGFLFGDGLFETILVVDGRPVHLDLHRDRLLTGAQRLDIACDWSNVQQALEAVLPDDGCFALRLTLTRGSGPRGYAPCPSTPRLRFRCTRLTHNPLEPRPAARLSISSIPLPAQPILAGIKHCNRLEQVLAAREADRLGVDDVLMGNERQGVQCSVSANVFALLGERLVTPSCETCGIAGTRRRLVMEELAPGCGLEVEERDLPIDELLAADAVFMTNAVVGLRRVEAIDEKTYGDCAALQRLQQAYFQELRSCLAS